jgi:hypothetical protein
MFFMYMGTKHFREKFLISGQSFPEHCQLHNFIWDLTWTCQIQLGFCLVISSTWFEEVNDGDNDTL